MSLLLALNLLREPSRLFCDMLPLSGMADMPSARSIRAIFIVPAHVELWKYRYSSFGSEIA